MKVQAPWACLSMPSTNVPRCSSAARSPPASVLPACRCVLALWDVLHSGQERWDMCEKAQTP